MGQEFFDDDVCLETLIRTVQKLQSSVAALIDGNEEAQNTAKLMYFSNQIIFDSQKQDEEMRITTKFL